MLTRYDVGFAQAQQLTYGSQLGWMDAGQALGFLTRSDSADELHFTRTLIRLKEKYQAFLTTVRQPYARSLSTLGCFMLCQIRLYERIVVPLRRASNTGSL